MITLLDEIKRWRELTAATSGATALVDRYVEASDYLPEMADSIADRIRWRRRRLEEVAVAIQINGGHATIVEDYRIRWNVDPETLTVEHPFRPEPENVRQRRRWHAALLAVETDESLAGEATATLAVLSAA